MLTKSTPVISIPVKRHVLQFFESEFGPQPMYIHQNQFLGSTLKLVLTKQPYRINRPKLVLPAKRQVQMQVQLPKALKHYIVEEQGLQELGKWMEKFFLQQLISFVKGAAAYGQPEYNALVKFFAHYNLDADSYDIESARKAMRDYRANLEKNEVRRIEMEPETLSMAA